MTLRNSVTWLLKTKNTLQYGLKQVLKCPLRNPVSLFRVSLMASFTHDYKEILLVSWQALEVMVLNISE